MKAELDDIEVAALSVAMQEAFRRLAELIGTRGDPEQHEAAAMALGIYRARGARPGYQADALHAARALRADPSRDLLNLAALGTRPGGVLFAGILFCGSHHPGGIAADTCPACDAETTQPLAERKDASCS